MYNEIFYFHTHPCVPSFLTLGCYLYLSAYVRMCIYLCIFFVYEHTYVYRNQCTRACLYIGMQEKCRQEASQVHGREVTHICGPAIPPWPGFWTGQMLVVQKVVSAPEQIREQGRRHEYVALQIGVRSTKSVYILNCAASAE